MTRTGENVRLMRFHPKRCPFYMDNQMLPCQHSEYWSYRQEVEESYYEPNPKLVEFSKELETKVSQALERVDISSEKSMKIFIGEVRAAFNDVWLKTKVSRVGSAVSNLFLYTRDEIDKITTYLPWGANKPSEVIKDVARVAGNAIKFLRIIAPQPETFSVPAFSQVSHNQPSGDSLTLTTSQLAILLGLTFTAGVGIGLVIAGKGIIVLGGAVAGLGSASLWLYNESKEGAKLAMELTVKYIRPFNACMKKYRNNLEKVKNCLVKEYDLTVGEANRLLDLYKEGKEKALPWAIKEGIFFNKTADVLKVLPGLVPTRVNPYFMMPIPYYDQTFYSPNRYTQYYFQQQYPPYRQYLEIFKCLDEGRKWIKINFPEGFSLTTRLDYIAPDMTMGLVRRQNITLTCDGKTLETKEQGQSCLNKLVQVKLPNGITVGIYLTYFDEKYVGGNLVTNDLLALSEKVTSIECSAEPI